MDYFLNDLLNGLNKETNSDNEINLNWERYGRLQVKVNTDSKDIAKVNNFVIRTMPHYEYNIMYSLISESDKGHLIIYHFQNNLSKGVKRELKEI